MSCASNNSSSTLYNNSLRNLSRKSSKCSRNEELLTNTKTSLKSFMEFYDSIPEYDDINHLSKKEFNRKLQHLREKQRYFYDVYQLKEKDADRFCSEKDKILKTPEFIVPDMKKPPSRRSVRIESPVNDTPTSILRLPRTKSPYCESFYLENLSDCGTMTKSLPNSPRKPSVVWKDDKNNTDNEGFDEGPHHDGITIPEPFQMTIRDEENRIVDEILKKDSKEKSDKDTKNSNGDQREMFRAHPVPIESQVPLFNQIMYENEKRRQLVKKKSKEALKSSMRPFSFTKREEELKALAGRLSKSSPNIFQTFDREETKQKSQFKAKPVPKKLFSNYIYRKMHEDEYYRSIQRKIRAEEMLRNASLPPSMAVRERTKPKGVICPRSYRDMYERQFLKSPSGEKLQNLDRQLAQLELDYIMQTPSPMPNFKTKTGNKKKSKKHRKTSSSSGSKSSTRCQSALESVNRSNLAAVLRIETARKRMEDEISQKLEEARIRDEARWREKVLRKRPVWEALAYSHEEDLNMRLQMRKEEERLRREEHKMRMQTMLGRVNQQPTLFERQSSSLAFPKTREELISKLCSEANFRHDLKSVDARTDFQDLLNQAENLTIQEESSELKYADENVPNT